MKKVFFYFLFLVSFANLSAQQGINYKAVISENGTVIQNQAIQVQITNLTNGVIDISDLNAGVYLLKVTTDKGNGVARFVKK